jgi:uncharacterized protein
MFNILSLDGGGSWAILQLLTLREKYGDLPGHEILKNFDLVIGSSGGSIVLAALAENWTVPQALALFEDRAYRERIFSANRFGERFFPVDYLRLFSPFGPKYSAERKGKAFEALFPEVSARIMCDLPGFIGKDSLKMVVCAYDALNNRAKFFKSFDEGDDEYVTLTQAIHGSTNAPILYFDFPASFRPAKGKTDYQLWDGALGGFNNPVVAGIIEAMKLDVPLGNIRLISIGTGSRLMSMAEKTRFAEVTRLAQLQRGKKYMFTKLGAQLEFFKSTVLNQARTILYEPPDWANYVAYMFLQIEQKEGRLVDNFIRLSPMIHIDKNTDPASIPLVEKLYTLDMDLVNDEDIKILKDCFAHWKAGSIKNQPVRYKITGENEMVYVTGYQTFEEAMNCW